MLFWAGLRGAVGVALAEGMKGEHAVALRTTVLVGVVMTVVMFGGTIGRMIEILGIRTGVDEEDDSSDEEDGGYAAIDGDMESRSGGGQGIRHTKRRSFPVNGRKGASPFDLDRDDHVSQGDSPYRDRISAAGKRLSTGQSVAQFRSSSLPASEHSSSDSDPDVLPPASESEGMAGDLTRVWRDGQWFTVLDERYLLPVFSNATASRRQASKKALLKAKRHSFAVETSTGDDFGDEGTTSPNSPYLGAKNRKEFNGSFTVSSGHSADGAVRFADPLPLRAPGYPFLSRVVWSSSRLVKTR